MGAYVQLLEYDNIEGMILLSELTRRRIRSVSKIIKVSGLPVLKVITNFALSGWPGRAGDGASRG